MMLFVWPNILIYLIFCADSVQSITRMYRDLQRFNYPGVKEDRHFMN